MDENIFMKEKKPISSEDYSWNMMRTAGGILEENPCDWDISVIEYSIKDELAVRYGSREQVEIFPECGKESGRIFCT